MTTFDQMFDPLTVAQQLCDGERTDNDPDEYPVCTHLLGDPDCTHEQEEEQ